MKKFLATILALTMVLSLGAVAFAAEGAWNGTDESAATGETKKDVQVQVTKGTEKTDKYKVTVSWDDLTFQWKTESYGDWNTTDHVWDGYAAGSWTSNEKTIILSNDSSKDVKVTASFSDTQKDSTGTYTFTFSESADSTGVTVGSADVGGGENAPGSTQTKSFTMTINEDEVNEADIEAAASGLKVGELTLTITGAGA